MRDSHSKHDTEFCFNEQHERTQINEENNVRNDLFDIVWSMRKKQVFNLIKIHFNHKYFFYKPIFDKKKYFETE